MSGWEFVTLLIVGVPLGFLVGYWFLGEFFFGWFLRQGTQHVRPGSRRPR